MMTGNRCEINMYKKILGALCAVLTLGLFFAVKVNAAATSVVSIVLPGTFYMSVYGDIVNGVELEGILPAGNTNQSAFWNAQFGNDFIYFSDYSSDPGFRLQMFLGSDFEYDGINILQQDIPAEDFSVYANWDDVNSVGISPTKGLGDITQTLYVDSDFTCPSFTLNDFSFNSDFMVAPFSREMATIPFDYLTYSGDCLINGIVHLGQFELEMGDPAAGSYSSSLFIVLVDGF